MKPLNQKEINEKFFNFMILFIVCVAVFSFALYYETGVKKAESDLYRKRAMQMIQLSNEFDLRLQNATDIRVKLNAIKNAPRPIKESDISAITPVLDKIYASTDSTDLSGNKADRDFLKIFELTRILLNDVEDNLDSMKQLNNTITSMKADMKKIMDEGDIQKQKSELELMKAKVGMN